MRNVSILVVGIAAGLLLAGWGIYALVFNDRVLLENNPRIVTDASPEDWVAPAR